MAQRKSPAAAGTARGAMGDSTSKSRPYHQTKRPDNDGVCINPVSGLKLTRAQRRQLKKNEERIDRTLVETDRRFFQRFPHRQFRLRLAGQLEIDQLGIFEGKVQLPPFGFRFFALVHKVASGIRQRLLVPIRIGSGLDDMDLPENAVREIWEEVSTPQIRGIEEALRNVAGGKP